MCRADIGGPRPGTALDIGPAEITGTTAEVPVHFSNMDAPMSMVVTLVDEAGSWKVDDVTNQDPEWNYSLRAILEAPGP